MPDIRQTALQNKFSLFLTTLGDENLKHFRNLCNAFAFMNFRADFINEEDKNISRMQQLMAQDEKTIQQMAVMYKEYKNARRLLVAKGEGAIQKLNHALNLLKYKLTGLRIKQQGNKELKDQKNIVLEGLIRDLRKQRDQLIEKSLNIKFGDEKVKKIHEAEELYIHTLVGVFNPGSCFYYEIGEKRVQQWDFIEILRLFPSDALLPKEIEKKESMMSAEKVLEVAFNFTKKELIALFSNQLHKNTICNGDFIRLGSSSHAMYLSNKNGQFKLFDPGPVEIKPNTAEALVQVIKKRFFTNHSRRTDFMPIGMSIISRVASDKEKVVRPDRVALINTMLEKRTDKNLNAQAWDDTTALWMAAKYGHVDTIKFLITSKVDLNEPAQDGDTPVWIAAQNGHANAIKVLADAKADCNIPNKKGHPPSWKATRNGHADVILVLAAAKADLVMPNKVDYTPDVIASYRRPCGSY